MELPKSRFHGKAIITPALYAWYGDIETLIAQTYDRPDYNLLDGDGGEHSQDSLITAEVGPEGDKWGSFDDLTVEQWLAGEVGPWGESQPRVAVLLNDLFQKGLVPAGYYCVEVSW